MLVRRLFLRWLAIAPVVLPVWLLVGWAVFGSGGWAVLAVFVVVPIAFVALGVVSLLVSIRPTVRTERAVDWIDVGVLGAWHAAVVATGFFGATGAAFGFLAAGLAIIAFWVTLWQLLDDGRRRVQASMAEFERLAAQQTGGAPDAATPPRPDDGVIVVHERPREDPDRP